MAFRDDRHRGRAPAPPALASALKRFYALRFAVTAMTMLSAVLLPWMCTAMLESVIFDGPSTVLSVSRKRTFTGAIRRAIQVRDRHCQHPAGCDVPAGDCDVDHITPYGDGGLTA